MKRIIKKQGISMIMYIVIITVVIIIAGATVFILTNKNYSKMGDPVVEKKVTTYMASFESVGGTFVDFQYIPEKSKLIKPADPVKEGFIFKGWYLDGEPYDFDMITTKTINLTAKWEPVVENKEIVSVIFDSNGGSVIQDIGVIKGTTIVTPINPTKEDYNFMGWYLNNAMFDFNNPISSNITLIANWEKKNSTDINTNTNTNIKYKYNDLYYSAQNKKYTSGKLNFYAPDNWKVEIADGKSYIFPEMKEEGRKVIFTLFEPEYDASYINDNGKKYAENRVASTSTAEQLSGSMSGKHTWYYTSRSDGYYDYKRAFTVVNGYIYHVLIWIPTDEISTSGIISIDSFISKLEIE